jgi:lipopolysaccharide export system permease protein
MRLDRHLARAVLAPTLIVLALLIVLNCVYLFVDEQSYVGEGSYSMLTALQFVGLSVPTQIADLVPAAVLIGSMIGLGDLARRSEITAMRAVGISLARIALTLVVVGILMMLAVVFLSELVAPQSAAIARQERAAARSQQEGTLQGGRVWTHEGNRYSRIETGGERNIASEVATFDVAEDHDRLTAIGRSRDIATGAQGTWLLKQYHRLIFDDNGVQLLTEPQFKLSMSSAGMLLDAVAEPSERSTSQLLRLVRQFRANGQDARVFEFALWSRISRLVAIVIGVLLALPFALGGLRMAHAGMRILIAIGIAVVFVLLQQIVASGTILSTLHPALLACMPTAMLACATGLLLWRAR